MIRTPDTLRRRLDGTGEAVMYDTVSKLYHIASTGEVVWSSVIRKGLKQEWLKAADQGLIENVPMLYVLS